MQGENRIEERQSQRQQAIEKTIQQRRENIVRYRMRDRGYKGPKIRGKPPIQLSKLDELFSRPEARENGFTLEEISEYLYGTSTYKDKTNTRQLIGMYRHTRISPVYAIKLAGTRNNWVYFVVTDIKQIAQVIERLKKIRTGINKEVIYTERVEKDIKNYNKIEERLYGRETQNEPIETK